jgi:hypothetical protein
MAQAFWHVPARFSGLSGAGFGVFTTHNQENQRQK